MWTQVAEKCGMELEKCKTRWKSLRDHFERELRKKKNLPSGSEASLGQEWQFFEIMSFLEEHVAPKQTYSNYGGAESQEQVAGAVPETMPDIMYEHDDLIEYATEDSRSPSVAGCSTPGSHCSPDSPSVSSKRSRKDALQEDFRRVLGQVGSILQKKKQR